MVYHILREQNADVYFSGLQDMWNLTDEWANFVLAYEVDLYETPYVLKIWVVSGKKICYIYIYIYKI